MTPRSRGAHRPALVTLVRRTIVESALAPRGETVLLACSGGPDSTAMLHVMAGLRQPLGFDVVAHGVDHGLRPEARKELDGAGALAARLGVAFDVTRVDVAPGGNLQERARVARREALVAAAKRSGATRIATAHTADDRAETLLMRLVRGTGPAGLGVLPPASGIFVRPLLRARKADVLAHLGRHGLDASLDPSNENRRFLRVRVRRELLPLLEDLSPKVVEAICALADASIELESPAPRGWNRAQLDELERALSDGRSEVSLWLRGGVEATVRFAREADPKGSRRAPTPAARSGSEGQDRGGPRAKLVKKR